MTTEGFTLLVGDVREQLRTLPEASVHCVVTSPPYFGLRDYGTGTWEGGSPDCDHLGAPFRTKSKLNQNWGEGYADVKNAEDREPMGQTCSKCGASRVDQQIGLEPTPDEYVAAMVDVFREVRRVLRDDGTVWLNLGDSYASSSTYNTSQSIATERGWKQDGPHRPNVTARRTPQTVDRKRGGVGEGTNVRPPAVEGLKPKDLAGIPWSVASALRADGWWLRADIIWWKRNAMPASVADRPTTAHEYVFLLSKRPMYFYDAEAVKEPSVQPDRVRSDRVGGANGHTVRHSPGGVMEGVATRNMRGVWQIAQEAEDEAAWLADVFADAMRVGDESLATTVWDIATQPYPSAHFATFPVELAARAIRAGTSEKGCCTGCGAPWARIIEKGEPELPEGTWSAKGASQYEIGIGGREERGLDGGSTLKHVRANRTIGWQPTCACDGVDRTPIETPLGESPAADPTLEVGRAGFERERAEDEGVRTITRYEQQAYAAQLRAIEEVELVDVLESEAGREAFAHYVRADRSGARPVPHLLLESWIERGLLERVHVPPPPEVAVEPCTVLDPFIGSGTAAVAALRLGRRAVGVELNPEYAALCEARVARWWKEPARARPRDDAQPSLFDGPHAA
jgi:site-specific DNA-methyltransferase (cytosine-N4-specific)